MMANAAVRLANGYGLRLGASQVASGAMHSLTAIKKCSSRSVPSELAETTEPPRRCATVFYGIGGAPTGSSVIGKIAIDSGYGSDLAPRSVYRVRENSDSGWVAASCA